MWYSSWPALFVVFSLSRHGLADSYRLTDQIIGPDFYNAFDWEAIPDPTEGRVNYVDLPTSQARNLTVASADSFILRADSKDIVPPGKAGRDSVRIVSKRAFTSHVVAFDVRHMPQGCGTWPAIWEVQGANWPEGGEVDILEGVNDHGRNSATLHTTSGCTMPGDAGQTGHFSQLDCDYTVNSNTGCSSQADSPNSYGPAFNSVGGGWYVMERSERFIKVWFWERSSPTVPAALKSGSEVLDTTGWGIPFAYFPNDTCDLQSKFQAHNIVINLTFCGQWAGAVYEQFGCPSTCDDYVMNNPAAFKNAFFDFASIRVYQPMPSSGVAPNKFAGNTQSTVSSS